MSNNGTGGTGRVRLSQSALARPQSLVQSLAAEVQDYLYFPDPGPLYVVLGAIAANMMCGKPVWLMLVGGPSSGKTEVLMGLSQVPGVHLVEDMSGPGALLSGVAAKDIEKGATGGILRKVGPRGCIVMEDFTSSVMHLPYQTRNQILTAFRLIHKGRWSRDVGSGGHKTLVWEGKLGAVAGGTPVIDRQTTEAGELGERWVYYRMPKTDGWGESRVSLQNKNPQESALRLREAIKAFFEVMELRWPCWLEGEQGCQMGHEHWPEVEKRTFSIAEYSRFIGQASLVAKMRSAVYRHPYSRQIEDVPAPESPPRLANALGQLYLGLELIGMDERERWQLVSKVAADSVPEMRARVVRKVIDGGGKVKIAALSEVMECSEATIVRTVEDLEVFGVVKKEAKDVVMAKGMLEEIERNFK